MPLFDPALLTTDKDRLRALVAVRAVSNDVDALWNDVWNLRSRLIAEHRKLADSVALSGSESAAIVVDGTLWRLRLKQEGDRTAVRELVGEPVDVCDALPLPPGTESPAQALRERLRSIVVTGGLG